MEAPLKRLLVGFVGHGLCPMLTKFEKSAWHGSPTQKVIGGLCRAWALSHADEIWKVVRAWKPPLKRLLVGFVGHGLCSLPTKFGKSAWHGSPTQKVIGGLCRAWALSHADEIWKVVRAWKPRPT